VQTFSTLPQTAEFVPVCSELVQFNQVDTAIRLGMFCAFGHSATSANDLRVSLPIQHDGQFQFLMQHRVIWHTCRRGWTASTWARH